MAEVAERLEPMVPEPDGSSPPIRLTWSFALQVGVWIITVMLAYGALNERISVLEYKYDRMQQDLSEIKGDVKILVRRP